MGNIVNKIYQSITENRDVDPKLKDWIEKKYGKWHPKDFISDDGDTYFKYESTSEGGGIGHKIVKLPSFSELIKQLKLSRDAANDLVKGESVRDDEVLRGIYDEQRKVFNKFRTHLRKEYPAFYAQLKGQLTEEELDEMSTTGGGAGSASFTGGTGMQYATPYAFKKKKKEKINEDSQVRISEPRFVRDKNHSNFLNVYIDYSIGAGGSSIALGKETMTGQIRRKSAAAAVDKLNNIAKDLELKYNIEDIEVTDLENGKARLFAVSDDFINGVKEGVGATLVPGPKASEDGVKDNAYVKQFKYSLVPKKIKGSGLEVKQLFEADDVKSFQQERIAAFDVIEQQLNDIYKMLSNAKNETGDYYTENPTSFSVIKPTDLVLDYIKDIKDLLKGE